MWKNTIVKVKEILHLSYQLCFLLWAWYSLLFLHLLLFLVRWKFHFHCYIKTYIRCLKNVKKNDILPDQLIYQEAGQSTTSLALLHHTVSKNFDHHLDNLKPKSHIKPQSD